MQNQRLQALVERASNKQAVKGYEMLFPYKSLKMQLTSAIVFALGTVATHTHASSLLDIYESALKYDAQYKVAEAKLQSDKLGSTVGRAALLPQVGFNAEYTDTDSKVSVNDGSENDNDSKNTQYGIRLSQPLFNAAAWHRFKNSQIQTDINQIAFNTEQQDIILRASQAYFDTLKSIDDLSTAKAEENALGQSLEQTRQRFEVGLTAITEVHEAQAAYDSARANKLSAEGSLVIAMEALEVLTGEPHRVVAPLSKDFPVGLPEPVARNSWEKMALNTNLSLLSAQSQLKSAEVTYKEARSGHLPTLSADLSYFDRVNKGRNTFVDPPVPNNTESDGLSATLNLTLPLYSGGRISAQRKQAAFAKVQAKETIKQVERQVIQQTRSLYQRVSTGVATVKARQQAIVSSQSALDATKAGYDVGTRNLVDVLNAQQRLFSSQRDYLSALYDYIQAGLELKQSAGVLSPEDIVQLDKWLNKAQMVGLPAEG